MPSYKSIARLDENGFNKFLVKYIVKDTINGDFARDWFSYCGNFTYSGFDEYLGRCLDRKADFFSIRPDFPSNWLEVLKSMRSQSQGYGNICDEAISSGKLLFRRWQKLSGT
jgi:hypothetical protein